MRFLCNKWPVCNNYIFFHNCCKNDLKQRRLQFIKHQIFCSELLTMERLETEGALLPHSGLCRCTEILMVCRWKCNDGNLTPLWKQMDPPAGRAQLRSLPFHQTLWQHGKSSGERSHTENNKPILNQFQSHVFLDTVSRGTSNCCAPFRLQGNSPQPTGVQLLNLCYIWAWWVYRDAENTIAILNNIKLVAPSP